GLQRDSEVVRKLEGLLLFLAIARARLARPELDAELGVLNEALSIGRNGPQERGQEAQNAKRADGVVHSNRRRTAGQRKRSPPRAGVRTLDAAKTGQPAIPLDAQGLNVIWCGGERRELNREVGRCRTVARARTCVNAE